MRKRLLLILLALTMWGSVWLPDALKPFWFNFIAPTSGYMLAQVPQGQAIVAPGAYTFTSTGTGGTINLTQSGVRYHQVTWNAVGNLSACGIVIQTATGSGGLTWTTLFPSTATLDCTKQYGAAYFADSKVNNVRVQLPTYTCAASGSCSVTILYRGYADDPTKTNNTATTTNITLTSAGLTQVIAAQTDKIAITFGALTNVGATTGNAFSFWQGTGTNCATGPVQLTGRIILLSSNTASVIPVLQFGTGMAAVVTQTTSGQALCMLTDAAGTIGGWLTWLPTP